MSTDATDSPSTADSGAASIERTDAGDDAGSDGGSDGGAVAGSEAQAVAGNGNAALGGGPMDRPDKLPVKMLSDRILVSAESASAERRTSSGILIPATAQLAKRLAWAEVRAVGPNVRAVEDGDHVLYNPEEVYEVEVGGETFIILRERDLHAMASGRLEENHTGLYL